jgi:L-cysteine desulfidase
VVELTLDGEVVTAAGVTQATDGEGDAGSSRARREDLSLKSIWEFAHQLEVTDVDGLISRQIELNQNISREGLSGRWGANIGSTLLHSRPNDISCKARAAAAAGSDARMSGCPLPVVINCGSGNQGITCSQPVLEYAHDLWSSHDGLVRAVVLSDLTAVHVKYFIGELSAFCGAVSASCGAGAGICYLRGGSFAQYEATIVNTLANVGGIVCDGAKPSCAAKISAAVDAAILGCDMALSDDNFLAGDGLVGRNAEETIRSMGYVGRVGMHPTDVEILNIMIGKTDVSEG